ncbi:MAG TPA: YqaE/Pmp3 family membrane protein [Saprospiraceae bacterium]|nr:YqaE/Pmp3 family membrane protein [Saprospiraceae bacterium]
MQALKFSLITIVLLFFFGQIMAVNQYNWKKELKTKEYTGGFSEVLPLISLDEFMEMDARTFKRFTGKKLGLKDRFRLWMAKKFILKNLKDRELAKSFNPNMPQIGYIILALIGFGWLAIGVLDNWSGQYWIISLILYLLFYIPGLIYTLLIMGNYY